MLNNNGTIQRGVDELQKDIVNVVDKLSSIRFILGGLGKRLKCRMELRYEKCICLKFEFNRIDCWKL